jgi:glycosyltransferase involved in cell wall biosynthesis
MTERKNLLIISDAVAASTGLARVARDLAVRINTNLSDVYRIATAGFGSAGSSKFPWHQYFLEGVSDWVIPTIREIIEDFAGDEKCIVLFIWDASRLGWFSQPDRIGSESLAKFPGLKEWLRTANIERWTYSPIDASGPNDRLSFPLGLTLAGFDRILAYGDFGEGVIRRTLGEDESNKRHLTWLPHGIDTSVFYPRDRSASRLFFLENTKAQTILSMFGVPGVVTSPLEEDEVLIGAVATNQQRKDWTLAIETCAILSRDRKIRLWIHTDSLERAWSLPNLLIDYGLIDRTVISLGQITDENLAMAYSACDITLGPGAEGFGFPLAESLACGTPLVTGSYAGANDFVPKWYLVDPIGFRYEGSYSCKRPVYNANDWANRADSLLSRPWLRSETSLPDRIDWNVNWIAWEKYLREAAK